MTDKQPEALRLADALTKHLGGNTATQAAAELRRLYAENAETKKLNDDLYEQGVAFIARISVLEATNQELLGALKYYANTYCEGWCKEGPVSREDFKDCGGCFARAWIAKAEGQA